MKFSYLILYLAIKHIRVVEIVNYIGTVCMYYVKKNRAITKYARKNTQMKKRVQWLKKSSKLITSTPQKCIPSQKTLSQCHSTSVLPFSFSSSFASEQDLFFSLRFLQHCTVILLVPWIFTARDSNPGPRSGIIPMSHHISIFIPYPTPAPIPCPTPAPNI